MSEHDPLLSTVAPSDPVTTPEPGEVDPDLLFGAKAIGAFLGMRTRQVDYLARIGILPVFRVGRKVSATRSGLRTWLAENAAAARRSKSTGTALSDQA